MATYFNGQLLISPVTASAVVDDAMRNANLTVGNAVAIVGQSGGGKPKTKLTFGSPAEAERTLVSGELLEAVLAAFNPSNETDGPSSVTAVRVSPAEQSTGTMLDGSGNTVINLASTGYGGGENEIKFKVEAGSLRGLRPTVQKGVKYYTVDNLERQAFTIHYTGGLASATLTISEQQAILAAPAGTPVATLDLNVYSTVQSLVDRINLVSGFQATVQDNSYTRPSLAGLDFITAQDVKTATYTVKADLQAVVDWLNGARQDFVRGTRAPGAGKPPAIASWKFMSGGSDGVTTITDWAEAFETLQTIDVQWVTPVTPDPAVHAMADAHVNYMSNVARRERRAIVGMDLSTTDDSALAEAKSLNSDRTSVVHIGHYNYNMAGKLTLFPAYVTAALVAGAFSGVTVGTPLTNKSIKVNGLERDLRNPTDTDVLINGGVLCLENTPNGYKIVKSISTWLVNDNYNRVEQSCGVALDFTVRNVREALDILRGAKGNSLVLSRAASITETTLRTLATEEPQGPGVLAGDKNSPPYRNIKATLEGDVLAVTFECSPVIPVNYVLVTVYAVPYSGTATAALGS